MSNNREWHCQKEFPRTIKNKDAGCFHIDIESHSQCFLNKKSER